MIGKSTDRSNRIPSSVYRGRLSRFCCIVLICALILGCLCIAAASASESGLQIESGVLTGYSGSSSALTVPEGVTSIAASVFEGDERITSVSLPSTLREIGDRAFYGCSSLSSVTGGLNVGSVGEKAFCATPYLDDSTDRYFMLGKVLLWYNGTAPTVSIPTACTAVAPYAFMKCDTIVSFTAHEGLLSIGRGAFYNCTNLSEVNLPSTLSYIGDYAFDGTAYLSSQGDFPVAGDGVLIKYMGSDSDVTVPDGVRRISSRAFGSSKLLSVRLPDTVYSVDPYAFADCVGLREISLNNGLVNIGDGAFRGCKSLERLETPQTLGYIGQFAFAGDGSLPGASLRGDHLSVSYDAFKGCDSMSYVLLSEGVSSIFDDAFSGCESLEGISVPESVVEFSGSALSGCGYVIISCSDDSVIPSNYEVDTVKGNVGGSDDLNIVDVTEIQRYIAGLRAFSGAQRAKADVNCDGSIDIFDASCVQEVIAEIR